MGAIMIRCSATGQAISTGFRSDRHSFARMPVFFARAYCPHCQTHHEWFAQEAWVQEADVDRLPDEARGKAA
jgi:hypothetical protein